MRLATRKSEKERMQSEQDDALLTQDAIDRFTRERVRLQKERIPAAEEVARLAAMGDLSENAAYQYAKQHLRRILSRILALDALLARATVIPPAQEQDGIIRVGSTVTVVAQGRQHTWRIVGSHETRPGSGTISFRSPVGNALLGHKAGDVVDVRLENAVVSYEVVAVA